MAASPIHSPSPNSKSALNKPASSTKTVPLASTTRTKTGDEFIQVEVRDLVKHSAHLPPPIIDRKYPPEDILIRALNELRFSPAPVATFGVGLLSNRHTLLQVRPLRAFRPMLSTDNQFCALNLYQLAIMANLSYCDFGQHPAKDPVDRVSFPLDPSVGHFFGEALSNYRESWKVDNAQSPDHRYYPLRRSALLETLRNPAVRPHPV
jgi:hypothetical protein